MEKNSVTSEFWALVKGMALLAFIAGSFAISAPVWAGASQEEATSIVAEQYGDDEEPNPDDPEEPEEPSEPTEDPGY